MNTALLNKVLDLIDEHPEKWNQGEWAAGGPRQDTALQQIFDEEKYEICGTQACVAGWALLLSNEYRPLLGVSNTVIGVERKSDGKNWEALQNDLGADQFDDVYLIEGARLLGLNTEQAAWIFLHMDYDSGRPHTFTDNVRHYLDLPPKWGTTFSDNFDEIIKYADGEELDYR